MVALLLLLALIGHLCFWAGIISRLHGTALRRAMNNGLTGFALLLAVLVPVVFGRQFVSAAGALEHAFGGELHSLAATYFIFCLVMAVVAVIRWGWPWWRRSSAGIVQSQTTEVRKIRAPAESFIDHKHHLLVRVPGNQMLRLDVVERGLAIPRLDPALEGFSVVHLSDLHFSGRIGKAYFDEMVHMSNHLAPDLVAITGDLLDNLRCLDWIPETLGRLSARHGVYFILGNHDLWIGADRLRRVLTDCGLVDLGGQWRQVEIRGRPVVLAGNELPWLPPAADLSGAPPRDGGKGPVRIALAHSPDQIRWARANEVDLLLAGHTHGGQIRLPVIGPIVAPSRSGLRYASGTFYAKPTVLHVSRGVSGKFPLRINCPPEIAKLTLLSTEPQKPSSARRSWRKNRAGDGR